MMVSLTAWLLAAAPQPFEGVLEYQLRVRNAEGAVKTYVSKLGVRSEASLPFGTAKNDVTVLVKADAPDTSWVWNAEKKSFIAQAAQPPQRNVTRVEPMGDAKVLDLPCKRVRLHDDQQGFTDYCVAAQALADARAARLVATAQRLDPQVIGALQRSGAPGLVVKMMHSTRGDVDLTLELVSVKRTPVDPALMK